MSGESICKRNELLHNAEIQYKRRIFKNAKRTPTLRKNSIQAENQLVYRKRLVFYLSKQNEYNFNTLLSKAQLEIKQKIDQCVTIDNQHSLLRMTTQVIIHRYA